MDATGHAADVRLPPMAWKTGTSAGLRDAWTVAWNPEIVVGVWVGNPDGAGSDALVGRLAATPVAWDMFRRLYPDNHGPAFVRPAGIVSREMCEESGSAPGPHCRHCREEWAIAKVSRCEVCAVHSGKEQAAGPMDAVLFLNGDAERGEIAGAGGSVRIQTPARGSVYRWMPELNVDSQRLALEATSDRPGEALHWFVDDRPVGHSRTGEPLFWPLERGEHQIVCSTKQGRSDRVTIAVE